MSKEITKRELVELLIEHLPPFSYAMNNLTKFISFKENLSLKDLGEKEDKELRFNLDSAVKSLRELVNKLVEISGEVKDNEMVTLLNELYAGTIEYNLVGIERLTAWLAGEKEEADFKEIVQVLFLGSQAISKLVNKLTE